MEIRLSHVEQQSVRNMPHRFTTTVFKVGVNPCVDVPAKVSAALGKRGYIPVQGTINGHAFRAGLVSLGNGRHRLFINGVMRRAASVLVNDRITVILEYDDKPRKTPIPNQLSKALKENPTAKHEWDSLTPSRRKEILTYLNSLKRPESLRRNVERTINFLLDDIHG